MFAINQTTHIDAKHPVTIIMEIYYFLEPVWTTVVFNFFSNKESDFAIVKYNVCLCIFPNYKMNTQLLAYNSNIMYADVFGPNYKMNTHLLTCSWRITS